MVDSMRAWGLCMEGSAMGVYRRAHEGWTVGTDAPVMKSDRNGTSDCGLH